jgi:hypothetical protein
MLDAPEHDAPSKTRNKKPGNRSGNPKPRTDQIKAYQFQKGKSGNPNGRPKKQPVDEITDKAREYAQKALFTYVDVMSDEEAPHSARVTAATEILNRGFGKAKQEMDVSHNLTISDAFERLISRINGDPGPVLDAEAEDIQQIEAAE